MIAATLPVAAVALPFMAAAGIPSTPDLGKAAGKCRPDEKGPAFLVTVNGLKDRKGELKLEVYPATKDGFLEDDNILVSEGKTFRRVEVSVPASGTPQLCIRVPGAGPYAVSLLHDRNDDRKFNWTIDGIGFAGNPHLGWSKPDVDKATATAGDGPTPITIVLNYRHGLGVAPLRKD